MIICALGLQAAVCGCAGFQHVVTSHDLQSYDEEAVGNGDTAIETPETPSRLGIATSKLQHAASLAVADQCHFYTVENIPFLMANLGVAATFAHTSIDQDLSDWYQEKVRSSFSDDLSDIFKHGGEQWQIVPVYAGAAVLGRYFEDHLDPRVAEWGDRGFRSMMVGTPPLLFMQKAIGSSRPHELHGSSQWNWWNDDNGVSGHTFVGAIPFLVAAQLADRPVAKTTLYFASTLTGWSRINDNDHYLSQVILGWSLAYAATRAVVRTDESESFSIKPTLIGDASGIGLQFRY